MSVIFPTCSLYPQQKRAYSALHPQAWTYRHRSMPEDTYRVRSLWISEDRLFLMSAKLTLPVDRQPFMASGVGFSRRRSDRIIILLLATHSPRLRSERSCWVNQTTSTTRVVRAQPCSARRRETRKANTGTEEVTGVKSAFVNQRCVRFAAHFQGREYPFWFFMLRVCRSFVNFYGRSCLWHIWVVLYGRRCLWHV